MPMDPNTRKILFPLLIGMFACFILGLVVFGPVSDEPAETSPSAPVEVAAEPDSSPATDSEPTASSAPAAPSTLNPAPAATATDPPASTPATSPPVTQTPAATPVEAAPPAEPPPGGFGTLFATPSGQTLAESGGASTLGSLDPEVQRMKLEFAGNAAGIERITFSDFWLTFRCTMPTLGEPANSLNSHSSLGIMRF